MRTLFYSLVILLSFPVNVFAQQKIAKSIATVKADGELVYFSLSSPKPFIFGNNRYILHIGNADFYRNKQTINHDGSGSMTFLIPKGDFNTLKDGASIYLTYGQPSTDNNDLEELSKGDLPCWSLGAFNKSLLGK